MWRPFLESTCLCGVFFCLDTVSDRVRILARTLVFCLLIYLNVKKGFYEVKVLFMCLLYTD